MEDAQRGYLRSLVAFYLGQVCEEPGTMTEGALVIDTDVAGFFKETERDALTFCFQEFSVRLKLELLLLALLAEGKEQP